MPNARDKKIDCLIIGAGPAGLSTAIYLARYCRSLLIVDDGRSRAELIPSSHNYPGFRGISGPQLLKALRTCGNCRHGNSQCLTPKLQMRDT